MPRRTVSSRWPQWLMFAAALGAHTAGADPAGYRDLTLEQALAALQRSGVSILYSSDMVKPWMRVRREPSASDPRAILAEILEPHDLVAEDGPNGSIIVARRRASVSERMRAARAARAREATGGRDLEEVVVSASRYELLREPVPPARRVMIADLKAMPNVGDDPLRTVSRLPGAATGDLTAKVNVRGGESDETLVRFDGLRLFNPYHLKDFHSVFSTIDPGVVGAMDVYTGGFPVAFGDRMSGVIDIAARSPEPAAYREISVSLFNASALAAGPLGEGQGDWLVSARRGNLDLLVQALDPRLGEPAYADLYGRMRYRLADPVALSGNFLVFDDDILLHDSDQEENARADYRDEYYWLRLEYSPLANFSGDVLLARSRLRSERTGFADQAGISRGTLDDWRAFSVDSLQTDWSWRPRREVLVQFGGEFRTGRGRYDYSDDVEFDLLLLTPGAATEATRSTQLSVRPDGEQYGAYANVRFEASAALTVEGGLRWDKETLSARNESRFSPRLSLLYSLGQRTRLRANWGRYFQAQGIDELQVSDGVAEFFPAQRADHFIASLEYSHPSGVDLRLEAYQKNYRGLRPRYENLLNFFVLLPELKPDRVRIAPDRATARGVEVSAWRIESGPLDWWVSYAWSSVRDEVAAVRIRRGWDQTHSLSAGVIWRTDRWDFSLAGRYHTGWPTTEIIPDDAGLLSAAASAPVVAPLVATGPRNDKRLRAYSALDARLARKFRFEDAGQLTVFLEVGNVLNRRNECCVEHEFEDEDEEPVLDVETIAYPGLLPSLGFTWQF